MAAWLTTVVAGLCFNALRTRRRHPSESVNDSPVTAQRFDFSAEASDERADLVNSMGPAPPVVNEMHSQYLRRWREL